MKVQGSPHRRGLGDRRQAHDRIDRGARKVSAPPPSGARAENALTRLRILLAEDHALVRAGLRSLLQTIQGLDVVGEAANGNDALRLTMELRPDVVLMDVSMPGLNGLEATRRATAAPAPARGLTLSMHAGEEYVRQALVAGAAV